MSTREYILTDGYDTVRLSLDRKGPGVSPKRDGLGGIRFKPTQYDEDYSSYEDLLFNEEWNLVVKHSNKDHLTALIRKTFNLLRKAWLYNNKIGKYRTPVYLIQKVAGETNKRYALVYGSPSIEPTNPVFDPVFEEQCILAGMKISISRFIWRSGIPGEKGSALCWSDLQFDHREEILLQDRFAYLEPSTRAGSILSTEGIIDRGIVLDYSLTNEVHNPSFEPGLNRWFVPGWTQYLQCWWKLDEPSGTRYDAHGDMDLTDNNTVMAAEGYCCACADFELDNAEYLSHAHHADLAIGDFNFAYSFRIKFKSFDGANQQTIFHKLNNVGTNGVHCWLDLATNMIHWQVYNGGAIGAADCISAALVIDTWYHVVVGHDAGANVIFMIIDDGVPINQATGGVAPADSADVFEIGDRSVVSYPLDAKVDEFSYWIGYLTTWTEILYNDGDPYTYEDTFRAFQHCSCDAKYGDACAQQFDYGQLDIDVNSGAVAGDWTATVYVKVKENENNNTLTLTLYNAAYILISSVNVTVAQQDGEWHRLFLHINDTPRYLRVGTSGTDLGGRLDVLWDAVDCINRAWAQVYCDGSLGIGNAWTGLAHRSTSIRTQADLQYIIYMPTHYTVSCWYQITKLWAQDTLWSRLWNWRFDASDQVIIYIDNTFNQLIAAHLTSVGADAYAQITPIAPDRETWYHCAITWDGSFLRTYFNGNFVSAVAAAGDLGNVPVYLCLGDNAPGGVSPWSGGIDEFWAENRVWGDDEIKAQYERELAGTQYLLNASTVIYLPFDGDVSCPTLHPVANHRDGVELRFLRNWDNSLGAYEASDVGNTEFTLFPPAPIQNVDGIVMGCARPWHSAVFNIGVPAVYDADVEVYYWNGGWVLMTSGDEYSWYPNVDTGLTFQTAGQWILNVHPPDDWTTLDMGLGEGPVYPIFLQIANINTWTTHPTQTGQPVYILNEPHLEIPSGVLKGDVAPHVLLRHRHPDGAFASEPQFCATSRIVIGAKSRGLESFLSHLNAGGWDNPGWIVDYCMGTVSIADIYSPGGYLADVSFLGMDDHLWRVQFTGSCRLEDYKGEYRAFLRCQQIGGEEGDVHVSLRVFINSNEIWAPVFDCPIVDLMSHDAGIEIVELFPGGVLRLPFIDLTLEDDFENANLILQILASSDDDSISLLIYDLILVPADEWIVELDDPLSSTITGTSCLRGHTRLDVDGGVIAHRTAKKLTQSDDFSEDYLAEAWNRRGPPPQIIPRLRTKLYYLMCHYEQDGKWGDEPFFGTLGMEISAKYYAHFLYLYLRGEGR